MNFPPAARLAMGCLLALVFAGLLYVLWRQDRRQLALREWSLAHLLIALAAPARASLGVVPDWLAIGGSGAMITLSFGYYWAGARRFAGLCPHAGGRFSGAALWLAILPVVFSSLQNRVILSSLILGCYAMLVAWEFRAGMRRAGLPSHPWLIAAFDTFGILLLTRAAFAWHHGFQVPNDSLPVAPWNDILAIGMLGNFAGIAVLLVSLARERAEQLSNARLTEARDQADHTSHQKSRFLAQMSHELRTPLNAVFGMAQVLARDPSLGPAQREQAVILENAGRHLLAIVNDALDLARVEAGRLELVRRPMPLRETLRDVLELAAGAVGGKRLDLRLETDAELPSVVLCDPVRLRQIIMNLLSNAAKFTPPGGTVVLAASWQAAGNTLRISVTDTGPGISAELQAGLFGEFAQGPKEAASGEGSGLGLAISAALARAMGGSLRHAPGPDGQGCAFTVELPGLLVAAPAGTPQAVTGAGRPLHLLVVDDMRPSRLVARAMLEQAGHAVSEAADGGSAVAALRQGRLPDAILMNVNMLPLDGHAATRLIRAMAGTAGRVPIIAMTADAGPMDVAACRDSGMDGHLAKPLDGAALLAELAKITSAGVAPSEAAAPG
jgi:signal transduction histidine kinase/ActR/RegA family two-component response regulator